MKTVSMKMIADKAGVSRPTVSEILNHKKGKAGSVRISDATRERVLRIAKELDYQPNYFARSLKTGKTHIIGVTSSSGLLRQFSEPYIAQVFTGIGSNYWESDYKLMFQDFNDMSRNDTLKEWVTGRLVDGLVFLIFSYELERFKKDTCPFLVESGIPFTVIHSLVEDLGVPAVGTDCIHGGRIAAEHLIAHGYKDIGFVAYDKFMPHGDDLFKGYRQAMKAAGLAVEEKYQYQTEWLGFSDGYILADSLIKDKKQLPRALVAVEEKIALGMITRFEEAGLRVPEDIALIGFGNFCNEARLALGLTVITQPAEQKGKLAAEILTGIINGDDTGRTGYPVTFKPELITGSSCGCKARSILKIKPFDKIRD